MVLRLGEAGTSLPFARSDAAGNLAGATSLRAMITDKQNWIWMKLEPLSKRL